ncbi:MAG: hypothetical protein HC815_19570 [Richelia sp. RM1_1_1]|nr:hypothetical protein [Richelia sp. RM1_1_1]
MKQYVIEALNRAYLLMQEAADQLYNAAERALENEDFSEYSFLESQAVEEGRRQRAEGRRNN